MRAFPDPMTREDSRICPSAKQSPCRVKCPARSYGADADGAGAARAAAVAAGEHRQDGLADNSAGRVIEKLLRNDLILIDEVGFAPLDDTGAQLLFRLISAAYECRALGVASHWPFESWGRFLPEHTTAVSLLDRLLHHANIVVTDGTQTVLA
jgi:hypothetical protein